MAIIRPVDGRFFMRRIKSGNYRFQRIAMIIACILWIYTAGRLIGTNISKDNTVESSNMVNAFCENVYNNVTAKITLRGKIADGYLSESARKLILCDMAQTIGINDYDYGNSTDGKKYYTIIRKNSVNGYVEMSVISDDESTNENYAVIVVELKNGIGSTEYYRSLVEEIGKRYSIDEDVNICLYGDVYGKLDIWEMNNISDKLLKEIKAKKITEKTDNDIYTIYAYDKDIDNYISLGKNKVNVNISMNYNEKNNTTTIYMATPINNEDY